MKNENSRNITIKATKRINETTTTKTTAKDTKDGK